MSKRKKLLVALVGVAVLAIGGIAYALWSATGGGSGSAKAITPDPIELDVAASPTPELYPGSTGGNIYFTASNPNPYDVTFSGFTSGTVTVDAGHSACDPTTVHVTDGPITLTVDANSTSVAGEFDGVVSMDSTATDACKGATFTIPLTLTGGIES